MYIGMDVGGTTARIRVTDESGTLRFEGEGQGGTLAGIGREQLAQRLGRLIRHALDAAGMLPGDCRRLCIGASGVDTDEAREVYEEILVSLGFAGERLLVLNDAELLVRMFDTPAIVLISGTGSIAVGTDGTEGSLVRRGGWEHLLSDEGSATWLGMELLRAYVRLKDGRGSDPVLVRLLEERTGFQSAQSAVDFCAQHVMEKADLAALAPFLSEGMQQGSGECRRILEKGAEELAGLAQSLAAEITGEGCLTLLMWGSVLLRNREMQSMTARKAVKALGSVRVCVPECTALDCAVLLARGEKNMPLREIQPLGT